MRSIGEWLQENGLEKYAARFAEHDITLDVLPHLTAEDIDELGLPTGARRRLMVAVQALGTSARAQPSIRSAEALLKERTRTHEAERRQLTVMFCDLVGSTALSHALDPEPLRELMRLYQQSCGKVIERYQGHIAQYLGDGLVVYFGWPKAHEDDAERAVRSALDIVEAVKSLGASTALHVRVGIATGPVVVGETGGGDASVPKAAVGETPNLAARLQALAQADEIVIAPSTYRLTGAAFEYADLGQQTLKGIDEPVQAWKVTGVSQAEGRFEATHSGRFTPFVGREHEIALLVDRWEQAREGEGQVVLLSGEPGIGKSRITQLLRERLSAQPHTRLGYQCSPYHTNSAFYPIINQFERAAGFEREDPPEVRLDKMEAALAVPRQELPAVAPLIASLLSLPLERYPPHMLSPQKQKELTMAALADRALHLAQKQPLLIVLEDAHWIDPSSLETFGLIVDRVREAPILLLVTHRPEFVPRWGAHAHVTSLSLNRLSRRHGAALVQKVTGGKALPETVLEQILIRTDGVPLFVEELTKSILESGDLRDLGDHYDYTGAIRTMTIPVTLRDSLMARLDRVIPGKEVAQIGAAIGREFSYELIAAVAPLTKARLDHGLDQLAQSALAFRRGTPPDAVYSFKHALVQDAAYDSLLKSRRQELHGTIARVIEQRFPDIKDNEPEALAHHLTAAGQIIAAVPLWHKAGVLAVRRVALTEAVSHLSRGLELVSTLPRSSERDAIELRLRSVLGTAWVALKGWPAPEVSNVLHPALPLAKSGNHPPALLSVLENICVNVLTQGRVAESGHWVQEMFSAAEATNDSALMISAHMAAIGTRFWSGELVAARTHGDAVLTLYNDQEHRRLAADPRVRAGNWAAPATWMLGFPDQAVAISEEKDALARRCGQPFDLGLALSMGAAAFDLRREPEELRKRALECERIGREHGMPVLWAILAPRSYGHALLHEGRTAEGISLLQAAITRWEEGGGKLGCPYFKSVVAQGMAQLGEVDEALALIDEQIAQVERPGWEERSHYAEILRLKGWMRSLKGDLERAERNHLASLDLARHQRAKSWELRTATSLARLWQERGKRKESYDLLAPIYGWFTEGFDTKDLKDAKALLDELS